MSLGYSILGKSIYKKNMLTWGSVLLWWFYCLNSGDEALYNFDTGITPGWLSIWRINTTYGNHSNVSGC